MHKYPTYLFFGSPGSGKGTHGRILGTIPGFRHLACGDVFRSLDPQSPIGKIFTDNITKGVLMPDNIVIDLWTSTINSMIQNGKFKAETDHLVLDGIPRTVNQAKLLEQFIEVIAVFHLAGASEEELIQRMRKRALKEGRPDDASEEIIRRRLEVYKKETYPVLDYYGTSKITTIETTGTPSEVFALILKHVNEFEKRRVTKPSYA